MYKRPRIRRSVKSLGKCQDCATALTDINWSASMRGETGLRPRHICKTCWTKRQRRYQANKAPEAFRIERNETRARREASWSEERKEIERRKRYNCWLVRRYGITLDEYDKLYKKQKGKCSVCKTAKPKGKGCFHVDHCHSSGKVRGLLCAPCNMLLGLAKDDLKILGAAMQYIKDHRPENRRAPGGKSY